MITRKLAPALAAGCTAVVKAASETPLTAYYLKQLALEAGIPDDAFQILTCEWWMQVANIAQHSRL